MSANELLDLLEEALDASRVKPPALVNEMHTFWRTRQADLARLVREKLWAQQSATQGHITELGAQMLRAREEARAARAQAAAPVAPERDARWLAVYGAAFASYLNGLPRDEAAGHARKAALWAEQVADAEQDARPRAQAPAAPPAPPPACSPAGLAQEYTCRSAESLRPHVCAFSAELGAELAKLADYMRVLNSAEGRRFEYHGCFAGGHPWTVVLEQERAL